MLLCYKCWCAYHHTICVKRASPCVVFFSRLVHVCMCACAYTWRTFDILQLLCMCMCGQGAHFFFVLPSKVIDEKDKCKTCSGKKTVPVQKVLEIPVDKGAQWGDKIGMVTSNIQIRTCMHKGIYSYTHITHIQTSAQTRTQSHARQTHANNTSFAHFSFCKQLTITHNIFLFIS